MSIGASGEESAASGSDDRKTSAPSEVSSFVEEARKATGRDLINIAPAAEGAAREPSGFRPAHGMIAAAVAVVLGGGFLLGAQIFAGSAAPVLATAQLGPPPETAAQVMRRIEDQVHTLKVSLDALRASSDNAKQDDAIRSLKRTVDVIKQDLEVAKAGSASAVAQLSGKIDRLDRDPAPKLAEIVARLDRLDKATQAPSPKLAEIAARLDQMKADPSAAKLSEITARLDRIERSMSSPMTTASIAPAKAVPVPPVAAAETKPVAETKSAVEPKPAAEPRAAAEPKPVVAPPTGPRSWRVGCCATSMAASPCSRAALADCGRLRPGRSFPASARSARSSVVAGVGWW